jgi:hypothetical protein
MLARRHVWQCLVQVEGKSIFRSHWTVVSRISCLDIIDTLRDLLSAVIALRLSRLRRLCIFDRFLALLSGG